MARHDRSASARRRALAVLASLACALAVALPAPASADAAVGAQAPDFQAKDVAGGTVSLSSLRGRWVVLEWTNPGCPFVQKHYNSRNMPGLQAKYVPRGVAWLSVNSTNPAHPDWLDPPDLERRMRDWGWAGTALLVDDDGKVGRAYGARTTPHMFVIDPAGRIVYAGAIDDIRSANPEDVKRARNHVAAALDEARAGRPVAVSAAPPYGCSVKY